MLSEDNDEEEREKEMKESQRRGEELLNQKEKHIEKRRQIEHDKEHE